MVRTVSAQEHEAEWWGSCVNTWGEEFKQAHYATEMGLSGWPTINLAGRSVLDIGGGPVSMLLKTVNGGDLVVVDPCPYPKWVQERYLAHRVECVREWAETFTCPDRHFDECWIYNVLQHVVDPSRVAEVALRSARLVRVFEWTNIPADQMHPHVLTDAALDGWFGSPGRPALGVNAAWGEKPATSWSLVALTASAPTMMA
jgi:hypothetical protein